MIRFTMDRAQAKRFFFDRAEVEKLLDRRTRKFFLRLGGYTRKVARNSMKKGTSRRSSQPGQAPRYHTRLLKDHLFFSYDPQQNSVVIGPVALNSTDPDIPRLLEEGGTAVRRFWLYSRAGNQRGRYDPNDAPLILDPYYLHAPNAPEVRVDYEARPYMGPAFRKAQAKVAEFWNFAQAA